MMSILAAMIHVLTPTAHAQSELDDVEAKTEEIQKSVKDSKSRIAAMQAELAGLKPARVTLLPIEATDGYEVESAQYFVDGRPIGRVGREPVVVELPPGPSELTAQLKVKGTGQSYLSTYGFRMQKSASIDLASDAVVDVVVALTPGQERPSLSVQTRPTAD